MNGDMLNINEAAQLLNSSADAVHELVATGKLSTTIAQDGQVVISRDAVLACGPDMEAEQVSTQQKGDDPGILESVDVGILEAEVAEEKRHGLDDPHAPGNT